MASPVTSALLTDTCSVYKLYFFKGKIFPVQDISVPGLGPLEFHNIVKEEFDSDIEAYHLFKNISPKPSIKPYPDFLDVLGEQEFEKISKFIDDNLTQRPLSNKENSKFRMQRKIYDDYRILLQKSWRESGKFQNSAKATSRPSEEDYLLLHDAIENKANLVTNDEILLEVSRHFMEITNQNPYMAEEIIKEYYLADNTLKDVIVEITQTMEYCSEQFRTSIVFN